MWGDRETLGGGGGGAGVKGTGSGAPSPHRTESEQQWSRQATSHCTRREITKSLLPRTSTPHPSFCAPLPPSRHKKKSLSLLIRTANLAPLTLFPGIFFFILNIKTKHNFATHLTDLHPYRDIECSKLYLFRSFSFCLSLIYFSHLFMTFLPITRKSSEQMKWRCRFSVWVGLCDWQKIVTLLIFLFRERKK